MFFEIGALKHSAKVAREELCWSLFLKFFFKELLLELEASSGHRVYM